MALYLVQHGLSNSKDVDPDKGLSARGKEKTELITGVAKNYEIAVDEIVHSGKKRAKETAQLLGSLLEPARGVTKISGINPLDDVQLFAQSLTGASNLMVVGHLPFLQKLVSYLTTGSPNIKVYEFQNSGIVCLNAEEEQDGEYDWFIKWTLNPNIS